MRDPNDTRDIGPRIGSPLWIYITAVTVAGLGALLVRCARAARWPGCAELPAIHCSGSSPRWPSSGSSSRIVTPGKSAPGRGRCLGHVLLRRAAVLGIPGRALGCARSPRSSSRCPRGRRRFRAAFNAAQLTLSLAAAAAVLAVGGIQPRPLARPWVPSGAQLGAVGLAAAAYFACNFVLVGVAVALHGRAPAPGHAAPEPALPGVRHPGPAVRRAAGGRGHEPLGAASCCCSCSRSARSTPTRPCRSTRAPGAARPSDRPAEPHPAARRTAEALTEAGPHRGQVPVSCCSTWTGSRRSTTRSGTCSGDGLLQVVAYRLARSVRPGDVVARLGGDEFAVLLPAVRAIGVATRGGRPAARRAGRAGAPGGHVIRDRGQRRHRPVPGRRGSRWRCSCSARTWPCTWPRSGAPGWRPTRRARTATPRRGSPSSATCAAASTRVSSSCTSSPRCSWPPAGPPAWRRCCAGGTRAAG